MKWFILSIAILLCCTAYGQQVPSQIEKNVKPEYRLKQVKPEYRLKNSEYKRSIECEKALAVLKRTIQAMRAHFPREKSAQQKYISEIEKNQAILRSFRGQGSMSEDALRSQLRTARQPLEEAEKEFNQVFAQSKRVWSDYQKASSDISSLCYAYIAHENRQGRIPNIPRIKVKEILQ